MRRLALFLLFLIALTVAAVPYATGWLFKYQFTAQIEQLQQILSRHKQIQLAIKHYQVGWNKSNASVVATTLSSTNQPVNMKFDIVIHHGPVVLIDNTPKKAIAYVEINAYLPDVLQQALNNKDVFLTMTSLIDFGAHGYAINYKTPVYHFGNELNWDGMSGQAIISLNHRVITGIKNNTTFNKANASIPMMGLSISISPITDNTDIITNNGDFSLTHNTKSNGINISMGTESLLKYQQINATNHFQIKSDTLSSEDEIMMTGAESSATAPITSISDFKFYSNITGISSDKVNKFRIVAEDALHQAQTKQLTFTETDQLLRDVGSKLITVFQKDFKWEISISLNTNIGKFSSHLMATLNKIPANLAEAFESVNSKADMRISSELLRQVLIAGYQNMASVLPAKNPAAEIKKDVATPKTTYAQGVADLVMKNEINIDDSMELMNIPDQNLTVEQVKEKIKSMNILKGYQELLIALYIQQYAPEMLASAPIAAAPTLALSPEESAITVMNALVSQGLLIPDSDAFTFSFTKEGNNIKINGSTDNAIVESLKNTANVLAEPIKLPPPPALPLTTPAPPADSSITPDQSPAPAPAPAS